jgi:hypothetical protein
VIDVKQVEAQLAGHALVRGVDRLRSGPIRIETAFLYPDGASIDLFLVEAGDLSHTIDLSDLGQTMAWLLDVQVKPWLSRKRQAFVHDALRIYGVQQRGGQLVRPLTGGLEGLLSAIVLLGQACVRVADLMFTKRSAMVASFTEQVEEVLSDVEVPYTPNAELEGRFGRIVRVDFLAEGRSTKSAILTLSSGNASQAHVAANEVFRRWYDLDTPARSEQRVTILDDRADVYRDDDIRRLRDLSQIVAFSDRQTLGDLLAA